eukprot:CAMPEP_0206145378 /NCGR_PEP_ID=MMETSP1473-20131121/27155_1 /ASSEMBLY_ACC=CAM_ASM_001109 /TAXON_ID=1461547 /ORGANISM="Stichococcus sp, Strain RCC1054" /LENGTH=43 /DNA_ID= /DNA_START= /DNA_END= /DNA_ORIENTATION=
MAAALDPSAESHVWRGEGLYASVWMPHTIAKDIYGTWTVGVST